MQNKETGFAFFTAGSFVILAGKWRAEALLFFDRGADAPCFPASMPKLPARIIKQHGINMLIQE